MNKIWDIYQTAINMLKGKNQNDQVALWILEKYLGHQNDLNLYLFQHRNEVVNFEQDYYKDINEYINGKPLARIIKTVQFYNLNLTVLDNVFCPRNETEILVENVIKWLQQNPQAKNVCDIGVGSGAICLSISKNVPNIKVYGNDLNPSAILCTYENAKKNDCEINLMLGSNLQPYIEQEIEINCLVANPPYISRDEKIEQSVCDYDPDIALFAEDDGYLSYKDIIYNAHKILKKPYAIFFEIGYKQANKITNLLIQNGFEREKIEIIKDYQGLDRVIKVVSHV